MSDRPDVNFFENGPYAVKNPGSLVFCGERIEIDGDTVYLCRCGDSKNAPFCDGAHKAQGFEAAGPDGCTPSDQEIVTWEGRTMRTFFNKSTCMHVYYCKPLKDLRAAELAGDDSAADKIKAVVDTCPSGALSYADKASTETAAMPDGPVAIDIREGGEIRLQVPFDMSVGLQERQAGNRATLCRCGLSKNKPFCDGRHMRRKEWR